jgi:hypothetical protein
MINILGVIMRDLITYILRQNKIMYGPSSLVSLKNNHSKEKEAIDIAVILIGLSLNITNMGSYLVTI